MAERIRWVETSRTGVFPSFQRIGPLDWSPRHWYRSRPWRITFSLCFARRDFGRRDFVNKQINSTERRRRFWFDFLDFIHLDPAWVGSPATYPLRSAPSVCVACHSRGGFVFFLGILPWKFLLACYASGRYGRACTSSRAHTRILNPSAPCKYRRAQTRILNPSAPCKYSRAHTRTLNLSALCKYNGAGRIRSQKPLNSLTFS